MFLANNRSLFVLFKEMSLNLRIEFINAEPFKLKSQLSRLCSKKQYFNNINIVETKREIYIRCA